MLRITHRNVLKIRALFPVCCIVQEVTKSQLLDKVLGAVVDGVHELVIQVHLELFLDKLNGLVQAGTVLAVGETVKHHSLKLLIYTGQLGTEF